MAKIKVKVDLSKKMNSFEPLPKADYLAEIVESEWKDTKSGEMLKLTFQVMKGDSKGKKFWVNLNLINESDVAVDMAGAEFSAIHAACGKTKQVKDTEDLHNIPMLVSLKIQQPKAGTDYDPQNVATAYAPGNKKKNSVDDSGVGSSAPWNDDAPKKDKKKKKK